jgi:hypothetical protein
VAWHPVFHGFRARTLHPEAKGLAAGAVFFVRAMLKDFVTDAEGFLHPLGFQAINGV